MSTPPGKSGRLRRQDSLNTGQGKFNRDEHLDFQACFQIYDEDKDGKLSSDETLQGLRALGNMLTEAEGQDIVMDLDLEHESVCSYEKFLELIEQVKKPPLKRFQLEEAFNALDEDGSGSISTKELTRVLQAIGEPMSSDEIAAFIRAADQNGDGEVDYKEFANMMIKPTRRRMSLFGDPNGAYNSKGISVTPTPGH